MSYTFGFKENAMYLIFSGDGENREDIWIDDLEWLRLNMWYDFRIIFDKGNFSLYINNKLIEQKELPIKSLYNNENTKIVIGENFSGEISNFYIKDHN